MDVNNAKTRQVVSNRQVGMLCSMKSGKLSALCSLLLSFYFCLLSFTNESKNPYNPFKSFDNLLLS